jgi:predicted  nucleic acid-binding Zn-ribbon protein
VFRVRYHAWAWPRACAGAGMHRCPFEMRGRIQMEMARVLLDLQEHDLALTRLGKQLDEMPEKRAILAARAKIADIAKLKERTDAVVRHFDEAAQVLEDSITVVKAKMDSEQAKLVSGEIANPKELQAVSRELDSLRRRVEHLEGEELAEMQKREDGLAQAAKIDAALAEGAKAEGALTERFKARGSEILARIETEKRARAALADLLPAEVRDRYETLRERCHGTAVGALADGMCSACRVSLPSTKVQALLDGPDRASCPNCGRILIVRGV